ncbi:serine/threonine-protein phosphatase [Actinobacteria bacterium YIM 96077]|uniref:PPM-type phosphatase domain-containing protein n=1 Tax=Phytoactinopolyspora halophila TaxID=1981511 RepID=A0A329QIR8_9ACTN|nr:protein phosphatase 2C domain-containing protein [Phytoactinopolyspora halophila]AYY14700.1 serine/threonine-protein phosphatase [Actinobacteria bacterium YIM 96077]RAW11589.1 hypothetical protein DPM12_16050 [Phytoactinopolyspora halophila]
MHVRYVARSDAGLDREGNEDAGIAGPYVFAVADGMGGHAAGEVASHAVISELANLDGTRGDPLEVLKERFHAANTRIRQLIDDAPARDGMGTTATAVVIAEDGAPPSRIALGHIGDSRAYLLRGAQLRQLTHDHTLVQALVDDGEITAEQARSHPARSMVVKALQGQHDVDADLSLVEVEPGDRILICSDGLTDVVADDVITRLLTAGSTPGQTAQDLIDASLSRGGPDNITVVLADILEHDAAGSDTGPSTYLVGSAAPE